MDIVGFSSEIGFSPPYYRVEGSVLSEIMYDYEGFSFIVGCILVIIRLDD